MTLVKTLSVQMLGAPVLLAALVGLAPGCAGEASFDSPESTARLRAIQQAAADDDRSSIPQLIEMLDSDDPAVRILSIRTLESMTGQTLGYDATAPSYQRTPAVDRWEQWYAASHGSVHKPSADAGTRGGSSTSDPTSPENRNTGSTDAKGSSGGAGGGAGATG